jgi:uncharacterized membrane protein
MTESSARRSAIVASATLGVGLSGFFDGILLHQVLQWHHLLSLVPGETFRDIRTQILADGLFHVLMYFVTALGLFLLWRRRPGGSAANAGWREVAGGGLLGFGLWNVIDVGLFHWILGIHRIRVNVPDPMLYDIGWLAGLGLLPLLAAWRILRGRSSGGSGRAPAASLLSLLALVAAPLAALPQPNSQSAIVLFAPGAGPAIAVNAAVNAGADILWIDPEGTMMAVRAPGPGAAGKLYRAGALLVTRSPALAGCAATTAVA